MNNYLYPFFWQHGEEEDVICRYMDKISESGMQAACIEARPHPEFVSDGWWHDMEIIIKKAKENHMQLWILDDSHFPTGYANGRIEKDYPQYKKLYVYQRRFDITGPMQGARIYAGHLVGRPWEKAGLGDKEIIGIYLAKRSKNYTEDSSNMDAVDADSIVELRDAFKDNMITLDVPAGSYSVFVVFTTHEGGEEATKEYLNPLMPEAAQILIDEVYQPHYEHFSEEFGRTITAFFSDEPRFGNIKGPHAVIGTDMVLPWRPGLENEIPFDRKYLPLLWTNANDAEHEIRYQYMDMVTKLYSENFTGVLAKWCNAHGVSYLGHNIEDEGAHCRLGYGPGHYFRAQKDQDYAGVDIIGTQVVPGMPYHHDAFSTGGNNGEFYHYVLGKLAGSAAHLEPKKKGRAMCEVFGAYGWNEGLRMMKWLTDHLVSRGINTLVPHAFNPRKFPDWDCAPHFYAHGNNPQFRYFPVFTSYANRLMDWFSGGSSAVRVGVLYNGKLEWYGGCMPIEKVLRELCEHQIDADIISEDYLEDAEVQDGAFVINSCRFEILFVPQARTVPSDVQTDLDRLAYAGVKVVYVGKDMPLSDIAGVCEPVREITLEKPSKELVYYHYLKEKKDILMFFNESITETVDTAVQIPVNGSQQIYRYDAFTDNYTKVEADDSRVALNLTPYESAVFILSEESMNVPTESKNRRQEAFVSDLKWEISYADAFAYPVFTKVISDSSILPLNEIQGFEDKAGTVAYETVFECRDTDGIVGIDLGTAYETAEVFLNERSAGIRIAPPYRFDIRGLVQNDRNTLRIEVTNTLGTQVREGLSQYLLIEPFGMSNSPVFLKDQVEFF